MRDERPTRILIVATHPVQYVAPLFRRLAALPELNLSVAYCSLQGAEPGVDPEFEFQVQWDVPLLQEYRWFTVRNWSRRPTLSHFGGLANPGLWRLVRKGGFDALLVYGYAYLSCWIAILAAKSVGIPVIVGTDAVRLESAPARGGWWWKRWMKAPAAKLMYRVPEVILVPSTATMRFVSSLGLEDERCVMAHYTVDNDFFARSLEAGLREAGRKSWGVEEDAVVALFCGKLVPWKRPQDLLRAFALVVRRYRDGAPFYAVFAGEGPLRRRLEAEAGALGVRGQVRFIGFVNQSALPEVYAASDFLVLPSEHEPWGLVVNEGMVCGLPAVVSDRVGARLDLIRPGETGEIYPCGDVRALAGVLNELLRDRDRLRRMGESARKRMETWSYRECVEGYREAFERAILVKRARERGLNGRRRVSGAAGELPGPEHRESVA